MHSQALTCCTVACNTTVQADSHAQQSDDTANIHSIGIGRFMSSSQAEAELHVQGEQRKGHLPNIRNRVKHASTQQGQSKLHNTGSASIMKWNILGYSLA
jgi:hypothetical protein